MGAAHPRRNLSRDTASLVVVTALCIVLCVGFVAQVSAPQVWVLLVGVALGTGLVMRGLLARMLGPLLELRMLVARAREQDRVLSIEPERYGFFAELAVHAQRVALARASRAPVRRPLPPVGDDQSAFLRSVSHELRTPLNAILGFSDVLLNELDGPIDGEQRENLSIVRDAGQRLSLLVTDMIEVAALSAGEGMRTRSTIDMIEVLDVVREAAIERRGMRPVHVRVDVAPGAERMVTERDTLVRALRIVTEYVLEVTQSGEVALLCERVADEQVLRLEGDGLAAASQELSVLLDEVEIETAKSKAARLRLAIAKELFVLLGARIELREAGEQPAAIVVRLPAGDAR